MRLADWQAGVHAYLTGSAHAADVLEPHLVGGRAPGARLTIHRRHYEASLMEVVRTRFPATAWLIGDDPLLRAAQHFISVFPPTRPCMAEYGEDFPCVLGELVHDQAPYVADFARLEWHVGATAIAVDGVTDLDVHWNVEVLFLAWLEDAVPEHFSIDHAPGTVRIAGGRGAFTIMRKTTHE